jgi:hypothetical protein
MIRRDQSLQQSFAVTATEGAVTDAVITNLSYIFGEMDLHLSHELGFGTPSLLPP